ncbi:MAG: response regulator [Planctomycetota bacterium]
MRATLERLSPSTQAPAVTVGQGKAPRRFAKVMERVADELRRRGDGLFAACLGSDELEVMVTADGPLGSLDRNAQLLHLDERLVTLAGQQPDGMAALLHIVAHEWRHGCGGALYGPILSAEGLSGRSRRKITRAWVPGAGEQERGGETAPVASPGGPREELLVILDDCLEYRDLDSDVQEAVVGVLSRLGNAEPYLDVLEQSTRRHGINEELVLAMAGIAASAPGSSSSRAAEQIRAEAAALTTRHLEVDRLLGDPRLFDPPPGEAARLLRSANDHLRCPPYAALSGMPGPDTATARNLLTAGAQALREIGGVRERRRRAVRRLAFLAGAEAAARHANQPAARSATPQALAGYAGELLRGAPARGGELNRVVGADLCDLALERADGALAEGRAREALAWCDAALSVVERRSSGADGAWVDAVRAARRRADAGLQDAARSEQVAAAVRDRRRALASDGAARAKDGEALKELLLEAVRAEDASPADVVAILTAVDAEWDGELADIDIFGDIQELARARGASPILIEGLRRLHGLFALASGRVIDVSGLDLDAAAEALASERAFESVFGIEDVRSRASIEARLHQLLNETSLTEGLLFKKRGLLRRESEQVPHTEVRPALAERLRDLRKRYLTKRDTALRETLSAAEFCSGLYALMHGDASEAWERFHAFCSLCDDAAGGAESTFAHVAALPKRGTFADANRELRELAPLRRRVAAAVELMTAIARTGEGLTAAQREKAPGVLERWRTARRDFPRVVDVQVEGADRQARLVEFLEIGAGGKEGQFAALRHLFLGRDFYPFLGYHVLEMDSGAGRTDRYVCKVGITDAIAEDYASAFHLLIKDIAGEVSRLRGNHQRELFVNRLLTAYTEDLRNRARTAGRDESRARNAGDQAGAQEARRVAERERAVGEGLLVPEVLVATTGDVRDPVPLLCTEVVSDLQEFPKSRFSRGVDAEGLLRRVRRQEERIAASLAVLHEQAKDDLRGRRNQVASDLLDHAASERVRHVRAHAACLSLLLANTDFQLFTQGGRMVAIDMGELIMPEVFQAGSADVQRDQTHRIDVSVVTETDQLEDFLDVAESYQRFFEERFDVVTQAAAAADLTPEVVKRLGASLAGRAGMLPDLLDLLIKSGGTLFLGQGGRFMPRERGTGTRYIRRRPSRAAVSEKTLDIEADAGATGADEGAAPTGGAPDATVTLSPEAARGEEAPLRRAPEPTPIPERATDELPAPGAAPDADELPVRTEPVAWPEPPTSVRRRNPNPYAPAGDADPTVRVDPAALSQPEPEPAPPPAPEPEPILAPRPDPYAPAGDSDATVTLDPLAARPPAPDPAPPPPPQAHVLIAVAHPGRRSFVETACEELGLATEPVDDAMIAAARLRQGGVDILVVDVDLPDVGGPELIRVSQSSAPEPVYTILMGPADALSGDPGLLEIGTDALLTRPCTAEALQEKVRGALNN